MGNGYNISLQKKEIITSIRKLNQIRFSRNP